MAICTILMTVTATTTAHYRPPRTRPARPVRQRSAEPRLHIHDFNHLGEILERIASRRGTVFMRDIARETEVGDGLSDEPVIDLLRLVEKPPAGNPGGMEMGDEGEILADIVADIAIHDLHVVNVEDQFHTR